MAKQDLTLRLRNRYDYGNNNPINRMDPDGRYTCDKSVCDHIKAGVSELKSSEENLRANPRKSEEAARVQRAITAIGPEGKGGPHYVSGDLKGGSVASSDQNGTTTIDTSKISGADSAKQVAAAIGHEIQHDIDAKTNGVAGNTSDRSMAQQQFKTAETNAYKTQNAVMDGFGTQLDNMQNDINKSVTQDLHIWDSNQPASAGSGN